MVVVGKGAADATDAAMQLPAAAATAAAVAGALCTAVRKSPQVRTNPTPCILTPHAATNAATHTCCGSRLQPLARRLHPFPLHYKNMRVIISLIIAPFHILLL